MKQELSQITQQLFHKNNIKELSDEELRNFIDKYPYAAPARYLLAKKKFDNGDGLHDEDVITAALYFHNPLWFHSQLTEEDEPESVLPEHEPGSKEESPKTVSIQKDSGNQDLPNEDSAIVFQSYHTIDYFASQGIRLQQADLGKDKLGQQLKSFTEWLRSMKKLPSTDINAAPGPEEDNRQQHVISNAASSIEEKEVVTETMAEVWAKQGNTQKAIDTYTKLSLLNPGKSAYFAAKIDQIK